MTRDRKRVVAGTQQSEPPRENVRVVTLEGGADRPQLLVGAAVDSPGDRAACLATVYTYLLQRRTRRLVAQAADRGADDADKENDGTSVSKQSKRVERAA